MNRKDIMNNCPAEFESELTDFIDEVEGKFVDIRDLLTINEVDQLGQVYDARTLAHKCANELY